MKKFWKYLIVIVGVVAVLALVRWGLILYLYTGVEPYTPAPIPSPDGSRVIVPAVNFDKPEAQDYLEVSFEIREAASNKVLYQTHTDASVRMRWTLKWIDGSMIRLDSSDIGTYCWQLKNETWAEATCP